MADFTYLINGYNLDAHTAVNDTKWCLTEGTLWRPGIGTNRTSLTLPYSHGAVAVGRVYYDVPVLKLKHSILAKSAALLEERTNELMSVLTSIEGTCTITKQTGSTSTVATGRLMSVSSPDEFVGTPAWACVINSEFEIPSVFFRGTTAKYAPGPTGTTTLALSTGTATQTMTSFASSTAPITDAVFRFKGPLSTVRANDVGTNTGFQITPAAPLTTQYLYVSPGQFKAWTHATDAANWSGGAGGTTFISGLLDSQPSGMLMLTPVHGTTYNTRTISATYTVVGYGAGTTVAVQAYDAFI